MAAFTKCVDIHPEEAVCSSVDDFMVRHKPKMWADRADFDELCENVEALTEHLRAQKTSGIELLKCVDVHPRRSKCSSLADFASMHKPAKTKFDDFSRLVRENQVQVLEHLNQQEAFDPEIKFSTCAEMHSAISVCRTVEEFCVMHKPLNADELPGFSQDVQEREALLKHLAAQKPKPRQTFASLVKQKFVPAEKDLISFIFSDEKQLLDQASEESDPIKPHLRKQRPDKPMCKKGLACVNKKCTFIHPTGHPKAKKRPAPAHCLAPSQWPALTK